MSPLTFFSFAAILASASVSLTCFGLTFIDKARPTFSITLEKRPTIRHKIGENVCLKQTKTNLACGKIQVIESDHFLVAIHKTIPMARLSQTLKNSFQYEAGPQVSLNSLLEVRFPKNPQRGLSSVSNYQRHSMPLKKVRREENRNNNMLFGIGIDFLFPFLKYQYALGSNVSAGFLTNLVYYPLPGGKTLNGYGTKLTLNYYSDMIYSGLWAELGIGALFAKQTGEEVEHTHAYTLAHLGYRWRWKSGPSFGFSAGAQYIFKAPSFSGLLPSTSVDISFIF